MYYAFTPTGREIASPSLHVLFHICCQFAWNPRVPWNYKMEITEQRRRRPRLKFIPSQVDRDDTPDSEWKDALRANGAAPCTVCGDPLDDHYQPVRLTCPTIVEDCAGRWWKL